MALVVAFKLPLFGGLHLHGCHVSHTGQSANVGLGKATAHEVAFRSRRRCTSRSQPPGVFKEGWPDRAVASSARPGGAVAEVVWGDSAFWCGFRRVLTTRTSCGAGETPRVRVLHGVVVVVGEQRLTGCGLTLVVCPVVGTVLKWRSCGVTFHLLCFTLPWVNFRVRTDQLLVSGPVPVVSGLPVKLVA
ncbi:hypothetical protein Taro_026633 [Colocasia esculenta]|uniref:Secreted protein n=1 Tax=Colocasia esculenta TaxID=4460 RepID=A0A843V6N0_COLES|nr:hypothetical protein [Colocasia esculenta]